MTDKVRVLIVLGRIGFFIGNKRTVLESRAKLAECTFSQGSSPGNYQAVVISGGQEVHTGISNAEWLLERLGPIFGRANEEGRVQIDSENRPNQIALLDAVNRARSLWPTSDISFHIVTSWYAIPRMEAYIRRHVRELRKLHGDTGSPRQLFWRFEEEQEISRVSGLVFIRESYRQFRDLLQPDPVPLVNVRA